MIDPKTGDARKAIMRTFTFKRISSCDFPAQEGATMAIMKRRDPVKKVLPKPKADESQDDFVARFMGNTEAKEEFPTQKQRLAVAHETYRRLNKRMALSTPVDGHSHMIIGISAHSEGLSEVKSGKTSWSDGHQHDWVMDDAGNIIIAEAEGHTHGIGVLVTKRELAEATASLDKYDEEADSQAAGNGTSKETEMSKENQAAKDPAVTPEQLDAVTKRAERAEAVLALPGAHREHFDSLEKSAQDEFLVLGPEQRDAAIAEAEAADEVVYKADDGTVYKRSDDPRLAKQAKQLDEERAARRKAEKKAETSSLAKRAEEELSHTPGTIEERSALLKAVDDIEDEEKRKKALEALKAGDAALAKVFETEGDSTPGSGDNDADTVLTGIAKNLRKNDPTLTEAQAYANACDTPEGQEALLAARAAERK